MLESHILQQRAAVARESFWTQRGCNDSLRCCWSEIWVRSPDPALLSGSTTHRNIAQTATHCPVSLTLPTKIPRLLHAVVVEVAEFGIHGFTSWARNYLRRYLLPDTASASRWWWTTSSFTCCWRSRRSNSSPSLLLTLQACTVRIHHQGLHWSHDRIHCRVLVTPNPFPKKEEEKITRIQIPQEKKKPKQKEKPQPNRSLRGEEEDRKQKEEEESFCWE